MPAQTKSPSAKAPRKTAPTVKAKAIPAATAVVTSEERHRLITEAAYYIAEKRGFQGGDPEQDWLNAAAQVDKMFMESGKGQDT